MPDRTPISPQPLTATRPDALPAYISNGLVGLRVERQPLFGGSAIVSGFDGRSPIDGVEGFTQAPYPLYGDVRVGSSWVSRLGGGRLETSRHDFGTGELTTRWRYDVEGVAVIVEDVAFCSRSLPSLVVHEISVTVDRPCRLAVRAGVDPGRAPGRQVDAGLVRDESEGAVDARLRWESLGALSECGVAYGTEWVGPEATPTVTLADERGAVSTTYESPTSVDGTVRLRVIASFVPSYSHGEPDHQAGRLAARGAARGFERLREENRAAWDALWAGRIQIGNATTRWQALTDASVYYLLSSVHRSTPASTSLFGLAYWPNYHYYHGHVMWDLDTFVGPPLSLLAPDSARALLDFRVRTLPAARQNAALNGQAGALYPWEASPRRGHEATPKIAPLRKDHVTLDVAMTALRYLQVTGDEIFARDGGRQILFGAAEWAASRVIRTARGFEIDDVTGPAEAKAAVTNDAWTNCAAILVLRAATALSSRLGIDPPDDWMEVANSLVVPVDPRTGILSNHDGYRLDEEKGGTPEGAAAIFPLGWPAPPELEATTFRFAIEKQAPAYLGTPMMSALFGVWAARIGERDAAMDLLERGYGGFVDDPFLAADEFPAHEKGKPIANPMFANIGGYLLGLLFGFPGIDVGFTDPEDWLARGCRLPAGWNEIAVERVWVRGRPARLEARHGSQAKLFVDASRSSVTSDGHAA
jgi:hypothetical protein